VVRGADGHEYAIELCPAKTLSGWSSWPWRWKASLTRDRSTWVTVERDDAHRPILRERFRTMEEATVGWARDGLTARAVSSDA
jgi:hypothetical protein